MSYSICLWGCSYFVAILILSAELIQSECPFSLIHEHSCRRNIKVFSVAAAYTIEHGEKTSTGPDLMISYHDNDHYNSLRDSRAKKPPCKPVKKLMPARPHASTKIEDESTSSESKGSDLPTAEDDDDDEASLSMSKRGRRKTKKAEAAERAQKKQPVGKRKGKKVVAAVSADPKPVKRGVGRPKKVVVAAEPVAVVVDEPTKKPIARKRSVGRPRKVVPPETVEVSTKKMDADGSDEEKRGRTKPITPPTARKRSVGRPRKVVATKAEPAEAKAVEIPVEKTVVDDTSIGKKPIIRKRSVGRPRKVLPTKAPEIKKMEVDDAAVEITKLETKKLITNEVVEGPTKEPSAHTEPMEISIKMKEADAVAQVTPESNKSATSRSSSIEAPMETAAKPALKPAAKPAAKPALKPVAKPAAKSAAKPDDPKQPPQEQTSESAVTKMDVDPPVEEEKPRTTYVKSLLEQSSERLLVDAVVKRYTTETDGLLLLADTSAEMLVKCPSEDSENNLVMLADTAAGRAEDASMDFSDPVLDEMAAELPETDDLGDMEEMTDFEDDSISYSETIDDSMGRSESDRLKNGSVLSNTKSFGELNALSLLSSSSSSSMNNAPELSQKQASTKTKKIKKGGPCACGSGKTYRKCCKEKDKKAKAALRRASSIVTDDDDEQQPKAYEMENGFRVLRI